MSLSSLIVQRGIATIRQVEEALARQVLYGGDLVTNLLEVAKLDEATLTMLLAESFGLAAATLGPLPLPLDRARGLITPDMASTRAVVPLAVENGALVVAVAEPLPKEAEEELAFSLGLRVVQRISPMVRVREALSRAYGAPLERRLQRLLARLGPAPVEEVAPTPDRKSVPPSAKLPFRASATPSPTSIPRPAPQHHATNLGFPSAGAVAAAPVAPPPPADEPTAPIVVPQRPAPAAARPARRRRGPIVPEAARKELEEAADRDTVLDLFFDYSRQYFDYSALFVVHADIAEGRDSFGDGAARDRVQTIGIPLDMPGVLAAARDALSAVRVTPATDGLDAVLLGDLERTTTGEVLVAPLIVRKRPVALFYGDAGNDGVDPAAVREVVAFSLLVGQAFEKLIVRKKAQGALTGPVAVVARAAAAPEPLPTPAPVPTALLHAAMADAAAQAPEAPPAAELGFAPEPPPPPPAAAPPVQHVTDPLVEAPPRAVLLPGQPEPHPHAYPHEFPPAYAVNSDPPPSPPRAPLMNSDLPPPANAFFVRRPSGPPIPREEPELEAPPSSALRNQPPPSETFAVAPHRPPLARAADPTSLPSVMVDVDEELRQFVDRVITSGADDAAETELLRQGPKAMPAIMSRFPGPTVVDRARVEDGSLRAADCGPVLRLIAGQRRTALPFVLPILGDGEPLRRYWATFLVTELPYAEVVEPLVPRLFDPDPSVRRVARLAARAVGEVAPEALMERLVRFYRDPNLTEERRIEMIDTIGELRERLAVPLLIDALGDGEEHVAAAARRALMTVTRQDLGRDAKKWQAWWAQNGGRHRLEWLIDALMHEVPAIRRAAGDELKATTKEYFGYYDDLPRKEREQAQARYREWWRVEGRVRFQRR